MKSTTEDFLPQVQVLYADFFWWFRHCYESEGPSAEVHESIMRDGEMTIAKSNDDIVSWNVSLRDSFLKATLK